MGCEVVRWEMKYLDLILGGNLSADVFLNPKTEKVEK